MTFDTERATLGRKPVLICEIELDRCANVYGKTLSNLFSDPNDFTNLTSWPTQGGSPVRTANTDTAPDSTLTADSIQDDQGIISGIEQVYTTGFDVTKPYSCSLYVKKDAVPKATRHPRFGLNFSGSSGEVNELHMDTSTGEIAFEPHAGGGGQAQITLVGDYWRIEIVASSVNQSNTSATLNIKPAYGAGSDLTAGASAAQGTVVLWGAQLFQHDQFVDFGTLTCTATGAAGSECFNTRETCQDLVNYNLSLSPQIFKLSDTPIPGESFIHCISSTTLAPTVINPKKGLGQRASMSIRLADFPHHDRGVDPYVGNRSYIPEDQGTYFAKLLARNRHYVGRPLRIKSGYSAAGGFNINDFQTRNYVIENISGPNRSGQVTIKAKDILKLADDKRAQAPAASTGALVSTITAAATSLTVTSGTEGEYNAEGDYLRIGDEIIQAPAANRSANVFSNLTRGAFGTTADSHDSGDSVQACKHLNADNVIDVVADLLQNYASIAAAYIPTTDWNAVRDQWYSLSTISTLITEPTGVTELVNDLAEQYLFQIWWNEIDQEINLAAVVPPVAGAAIDELTDDSNLVLDSTDITRNEETRLSRILFYYDPITPIEGDEPQHFKGFYVQILADEESANEYGDTRQKVIYGRYVGSQALAVQTAGRTLSRWADAPREAKFKLDAKELNFWTGDLVDLNTRRIQGTDGANSVTRTQVLSVGEVTRPASGSEYELKALEVNYKARYGYIGPDTLNDYDVETDANKTAYGFIAPDTGTFTSDGEEAYRII